MRRSTQIRKRNQGDVRLVGPRTEQYCCDYIDGGARQSGRAEQQTTPVNINLELYATSPQISRATPCNWNGPVRDGDIDYDFGTGFGGNCLHHEGLGGTAEVVDIDHFAVQSTV